jgi:hypothetical protein
MARKRKTETEIVDNTVVEETITKENYETPNNQKEEVCKILWVRPNRFAFSFKGYGIIRNDKIDLGKKNIKVKYKGEIGKPNFKITSYK